MAYQRSILQYWNGSAWTTAYVTGTSNALISFHITEVMGSPRNGIATLSNRSSDPYHATASSRKGPLTGVFTDFMQIRIRDEESFSILFAGRVYGIKEVYDPQYGSVIELNCRDALAELRDNLTDGGAGFTLSTSASSGTNIGPGSALDSSGDYYSTAHADRSGIVKSLIRLYSRSGNITMTGDANKFTESNQKFRANGKYELGTQSQKSPLAHIATLASAEPLDATGTSFSYDYYVDANTTSTASSHKPAAFFNYFPRATRPTTNPATYGLKVEYPQSGGFAIDGRTEVMLQDFDFERPKEDLFSDAIIHYVDAGEADGEENELIERTINVELWKIKSISNGGSFTCYPNNLNRSLLTGDTIELTNGTNVGKLQYLSATSGGSDESPEYALVSDVNTSMVETANTVYRSEANTSSTFTLISRQSATYGINRTFRINASNESRPGSIIENVVSKLMRTSHQVVRGRVKILRRPQFYVDSTINISSSTVTWSGISNYGLQSGMTVVKLDANDEPTTTYAYVTAVSTNTFDVSSWSTGSVSNGDKLRAYIPVRSGDMIYVRNDLVGITGMKAVITGMTYSEQPGVSSTDLDIVGSESRAEGGWARPSIVASIANAVSQKVELPKHLKASQQGKGNQSFSTNLKITGTTSTSSSAHRHIKWSAATITTADEVSATISAGGDPNNDDTGSYNIYGVGNITQLAQNTTYYAFVDYNTYKGTTAKTLQFTENYAILANEQRVGLATITVTTDDDGKSPSIIPMGSNSQVISGFDISAQAIKSEYIQAGAIDTDQLVATAINGMTITGSQIRTDAASNTGIKLNDSSNGILQIYANNNDTGASATQRLEVYDNAGVRRLRLRTFQSRDFGLNFVPETAGFMLTYSGSTSGTSTPYGLFPQGQTNHAHLGYIFENTSESFWGTSGATPSGKVYGWGGLLLVAGGSTAARYLQLLHGGTNNYKLTFPTALPTANKVLKVSSVSNGNATLVWDTSGWTIAGVTGDTEVITTQTVAFHGSGGITTAYSASSNTLTIDASNVSGSGVTLTGSTNNTIATVTGANALTGEANLTFDGTNRLEVGTTNGGTIGWGNVLLATYQYYSVNGVGSVSNPSFTFIGDMDTGFYRVSEDRIGVAVDGELCAEFSDTSGLSLHKIGSSTGADPNLVIGATGAIYKDTSSKRYKKNIADLDFNSDIIYQLRPVSFDWKKGVNHDFGLIAEEVDEVIPELVGHDTEGQAENVKYAKLTVLLLEEVRKLKQEIEELKEKI